MQHSVDRRVPGVRRVAVERIVDVCGSGVQSPAFQGQAVDVSGRGMQLRAAHLPALGSPLVLRFREPAGEVIAEGEVAWRNEAGSDGGGAFGVRFTALDSASVRSLKALCREAQEMPAAEAEAPSERGEPAETDHDTEPVPPAAPFVKLHLSGRAPIQAQIRQRGTSRLELGSQLEFLRVGRALEIEELAQGERRAALIDAVNVSVDESTRVPELIVSVRFSDAVEATPPPAPSSRTAARERLAAVVDSASQRLRRPSDVARARASAEAEPIKAKAEGVDTAASPAASSAAAPSAATSSAATSSAAISSVAISSAAVMTPTRAALASPTPPVVREDESWGWDTGTPRAASVAKAGTGAPGALDTPDSAERPKQAASLVNAHEASDEPSAEDPADDADSDLSSGENAADPAGVHALQQRLEGAWKSASSALRSARSQCSQLGGAAARGAGWLWTRAGRARAGLTRTATPQRRSTAAVPPSSLRQRPVRQQSSAAPHRMSSAAGSPENPRRAPRYLAITSLLVVTSVGGVWLGRRSEPASRDVSSAAPPAAAALPSAPAAPAPEPQPSQQAPAPAPGPAEELDPAEAEAETAVARLPLFGPSNLGGAADPAAKPAEIALSRSKVADQRFEDAPKPRARAGQTEFKSGRLHLPIVYRLRLDQPGEVLRGERTPTGFDVVIADRRVMESGADIARRDKRIAKVITRNESGGTRVSFRFRQSIPAYKVRLRKDFVEFFISES